MFVADALQFAAAHVARFRFVREQIDARSEPAVLPVVQQERPAQLAASVIRKRPVRIRVDGTVVHHYEPDDVDVLAGRPKVHEYRPDVVYVRLLRPHSQKIALLRDVQQPQVQEILGQKYENALHQLLLIGERRVRHDHFWALHCFGERIDSGHIVDRTEFVEIQINGPPVKIRPRDVRQAIEQFGRGNV